MNAINVIYTPGTIHPQMCNMGRFTLLPGSNFFTPDMHTDIAANELYQTLKAAGVIQDQPLEPATNSEDKPVKNTK